MDHQTAETRYRKGQKLQQYLDDPVFVEVMTEVRQDIGREILSEPDEQKRNALYFEAHALDRITGKMNKYKYDNSIVDKQRAKDAT